MRDRNPAPSGPSGNVARSKTQFTGKSGHCHRGYPVPAPDVGAATDESVSTAVRIGGGKRAGVEDGRQVGAVIDVEMREEDDIHFVEIEIEFADFDECAGTGVDENARDAGEQNDVAGFATSGGARSA